MCARLAWRPFREWKTTCNVPSSGGQSHPYIRIMATPKRLTIHEPVPMTDSQLDPHFDAQSKSRSGQISRRRAIQTASAIGAAVASPLAFSHAAEGVPAMTKLKGHIHHSIVYWCFNVAGDKWDIEKMCQVAKELGCESIELADPETWPTLKKHGLVCALAPNGMPGAPFMKGFNNPRYHDEVIASTTKMIDACAAASSMTTRRSTTRRSCGSWLRSAIRASWGTSSSRPATRSPG